MTDLIKKTLADNPVMRWTVLLMVSLTMMFGYYLCDVMAPLEGQLSAVLKWSGSDYGIFNSAYGWLNVILVMIIFAGMVLDKIGPRLTGIIAVGVMVGGIALKVFALVAIEPGQMLNFWFFGQREISSQVLLASCGFAIFAMGYETMGITASKIIVRWFRPSGQTGVALGVNVALARIGSAIAMFLPLPLANWLGSLAAPVYIGLFFMCLGFVTFIVFALMDKRLDKQVAQEGVAEDEKFRISDIGQILRLRGFWLITLLCMFFYSAVFSFVKFVTAFTAAKFSVSDSIVGWIPAMLPLCAMFLTPFFGNLYDKRGRGATMMIVGSIVLVFIFVLFAIDGLNHWMMAGALILVLGIAFSLVPSVIWPAIANVVPQQRLGTAYALTVWLQNFGMMIVPIIVAWARDSFSIVSQATQATSVVYDYTLQMLIFAGLGVIAVVCGVLFRREDRIKQYGVENHLQRKD